MNFDDEFGIPGYCNCGFSMEAELYRLAALPPWKQKQAGVMIDRETQIVADESGQHAPPVLCCLKCSCLLSDHEFMEPGRFLCPAP